MTILIKGMLARATDASVSIVLVSKNLMRRPIDEPLMRPLVFVNLGIGGKLHQRLCCRPKVVKVNPLVVIRPPWWLDEDVVEYPAAP